MTLTPPQAAAEEGVHNRPEAEAGPPDDDRRWQGGFSTSSDPQSQLDRCQRRLAAALSQTKPQTLAAAITKNGCTSLSGGPGDWAKCRICPQEGLFAQMSGYYKAQRAKIFICAEKDPSQEQIESILTHELVHAYDHCRYSVRVPFVGRQAPWALTCGAEACSEVRAYLSELWKPPAAFSPSVWGDVDDSPQPASRQAASPAEAAELHRDHVYRAAFASTQSYGMCAKETILRGSAKEVLDRTFDACLQDFAPFTPAGTASAQSGFPPMPPDVAAADERAG